MLLEAANYLNYQKENVYKAVYEDEGRKKEEKKKKKKKAKRIPKPKTLRRSRNWRRSNEITELFPILLHFQHPIWYNFFQYSDAGIFEILEQTVQILRNTMSELKSCVAHPIAASVRFILIKDMVPQTSTVIPPQVLWTCGNVEVTLNGVKIFGVRSMFVVV